MSQRRPNVWELVVNLGREVRPALRSIPARAGQPPGSGFRPGGYEVDPYACRAAPNCRVLDQ